jgi:hypothetical protein
MNDINDKVYYTQGSTAYVVPSELVNELEEAAAKRGITPEEYLLLAVTEKLNRG